MFRVLLLLLVLFISIIGCLSQTPVKYTLCSVKGALLELDNVTSSEWPPSKGADLKVNFTGVALETITAGEWTVKIKWEGFPLPASTGDIGDFYPLPWEQGPLAFGLVSDIPDTSPSGSYTVEISAVEQSKKQLFCVNLAFSLHADEEAAKPTIPTQIKQTHHLRKQRILKQTQN